MNQLQEAASLLAHSLRTRRDLLGPRRTGVSREALERLGKADLQAQNFEISNLKSKTSRAEQLASISEAVKVCRKCEHLAAFRTSA